MKKINVSIVEHSETLRRGLTALLNDAPDLRCRSTCASAEEALLRLPSDAPDIVLMDTRLPGLSGIECVARLAGQMPKARVLMLTAYEDSEDIFRSLAAGAHGYLVQSTAPEQLLEAIREVAAGGSPISGSVARKIVDFFHVRPAAPGGVGPLAPREREVLKLLAEGCPYQQIAAAMNLPAGTVRTCIQQTYEKLHAHGRAEVALQHPGQSPSAIVRPGRLPNVLPPTGTAGSSFPPFPFPSAVPVQGSMLDAEG